MVHGGVPFGGLLEGRVRSKTLRGIDVALQDQVDPVGHESSQVTVTSQQMLTVPDRACAGERPLDDQAGNGVLAGGLPDPLPGYRQVVQGNAAGALPGLIALASAA